MHNTGHPFYRSNYLNIDWSIADDNAMLVTIFDMSGKKISSQRYSRAIGR